MSRPEFDVPETLTELVVYLAAWNPDNPELVARTEIAVLPDRYEYAYLAVLIGVALDEIRRVVPIGPGTLWAFARVVTTWPYDRPQVGRAATKPPLSEQVEAAW